jgi:GNAT superfamily N-acetyltransferase
VTTFADSKRSFDLIEATLPEHIEQARELFLEYGQSLGFSLCFQSFDAELQSLPGAYGPPRGKLLLARSPSKDHAVGWIALRELKPDHVEGKVSYTKIGVTKICEMKRLYVRPDDRGSGLGRLLVERLIDEARALGYERMRLDTIASEMKDAVALYRRMGFQEIAPYSSVPIDSALWLELLL